MSHQQSYTLWRGFTRRFHESRSRRGLPGAIARLLQEGFDFLRDSTPSRRRQRWGDIDFDCDFGVDTTAARLRTRTRLLGALAGGQYQPSEPALFRQMLDALPIDFRGFVFVDLGSGKGRALLMASDYPFHRILGVELLPDLHAIAQENIANYHRSDQKCCAIESRCGDALEFEFPPEPTVIYIFNPFPEPGVAKLITRIEASLERNPRPLYIVYHNPILEHLLSSSALLRRITGTNQFAVYGTVGFAAGVPVA